MVHLQKAVRLAPSYLPARLRLADAYFKLGDPDAAARTYSAALARDPESPEALFGMARILVDRDKLEVARELLERIDRSGERHLSGLSLLARVLDRQGEAKQAAAVRNRLSGIKDAPMIDAWMEEVAVYCCDEQTLGFRFEDAFNSGRVTLAFRYLDRMQELFPDRWLSYYYRGYALRATGRGPMAAFYLRKAASLGGDAAKVYPELVETLIAVGQFAEAEAAGLRGLKLAPDLPQLCVALGKVAQEQHDLAETKRWYTRALHLDPLNVESNKALAEIHWKAGANARAVEHLERLVSLSPLDWAARAFLAQIHLQENRATPALKLLEEALIHQPEDKELLRLASLASLRIGNDFARAGSFAEAIASYERTLSWDPANLEALANKAQVQAAKRLLQGDMQNVPEAEI